MHRKAITSIALALFIAGCGSTPGERAVTGSGIGAGAGAIIGAVTGLTVIQGALIGAGAGGITGALTDNSNFNLGRPIWEWGSGSSSAKSSKGQPFVRNIQSGLSRLGFNPGPVDGIAGHRTKLAIRQYQKSKNLPVNGRATRSLEQQILADANRA